MELKGKVFDQGTGAPLSGVTIWEIPPDGRSANVLGYSLPDGSFTIDVENSASTINFVTDQYLGLQIPAGQVAASDAVLLQKDGSITAKLTLSGLPAWLWVVAAFGFIFFIGDNKKRR
jgi:hypothetical protein